MALSFFFSLKCGVGSVFLCIVDVT
jgi:hypothetical protein